MLTTGATLIRDGAGLALFGAKHNARSVPDEFDLIIVGAGINGCGVARDAAIRGLTVLLVDKTDISAGTTAYSTRLIHGGLRYLEYAEFGLVRESLREREILFRIAPHLVKPLPLLIPIYANGSRGPWTIRAGMVAYDVLSFDKSVPRHQMLSTGEALKQVPGLNPTGLLGASVYYDAQVEFAERLAGENALSAVESGAFLATYQQVTGLLRDGGRVRGVRMKGNLSGEECEVFGRMVINATGPWVDQTLVDCGVSSPRLLGGTKGSHIVVGPFPGAPSTAVYVEAEKDHRPIFVIPWNGNYLIGTTDIHYEGPTDCIQIDQGETDYLLYETNRLLPGAQLSRSSILFTYSGIRPLPFKGDQHERSITRRHFVRKHKEVAGLLSLIGGKLTTYRSLAEEVVDICLQSLGERPVKCTTATTALPGARELTAISEDLAERNELGHSTRQHLLDVYGSRAAEVLRLGDDDGALTKVIDSESGAIAAEIVFAFSSEAAQTLTDCLLRRTMLGFNSNCGLNACEAAAEIGQTHLGWSSNRMHREVEDYRSYVEKFRVC